MSVVCLIAQFASGLLQVMLSHVSHASSEGMLSLCTGGKGL